MKCNRVRFNVGGKKFETTETTLATAGAHSFFGPILSDNWYTNIDDDDEVFIDRNPDCFAVILDLLRTGELSVPPHVSKDSLIREADYYGVLELVRAASWGSPLNGDFALPSTSVTCRAKPTAAKMIFGSPNGGFCVANDTSVHVYDWMLREHPPIRILDNYGKMNDGLWAGANYIAVATTETVAMFDAVTGKLEYKFMDGATSMCLSDYNIFYLRQKDNSVIGMLDLESGKSIGSLYLSFPRYLRGNYVWKPINLQSIDHGSSSSSNSILVATYVICHPSNNEEYFEAQILDTRDRVIKRSWSCRGRTNKRMIRGATVMEDRNSMCVISSDGEIGFLDLRFITGDIQWGSSKKIGGSCLPAEETIKSIYHGDRLFMLSSKRSLVNYSVKDLVMTSVTGDNSIIQDFSISGDRLFMLHSKTNLVDVWETPRPSCVTLL